MTRSADGQVEYVPDPNCPDVYRLSWWRAAFQRFAPKLAARLRIDLTPRMVAYHLNGKVYCSYRTYAAFVQAGIIPSPPLNFQMPRGIPHQNAQSSEAVH